MMSTTRDLRTRRTVARIPGSLVCLKAGISRSRLSDIEREYVTGTPEELSRIEASLKSLIQAKRRIDALAAEVGWPGEPARTPTGGMAQADQQQQGGGQQALQHPEAQQ